MSVSKRNQQIIDYLLSTDLLIYDNLNNLFSMAVTIQEDDLEYSLILAQKVKAYAGRGVKKDTRFERLYYDAMLLRAPYKFDDYLLYLEKDRDRKSRFYQPKRKQLNKFGLIQALQDLEDDKLDLLSISMPPGTQKASAMYSKVLTPTGFVEMKDIKVGSKVIAGSGNISTVLGVYPQGVKPIYEITLDDDSKCRCSDEHLWTVQTRDDRRRKSKDGSEKYRTVELKSMLKNYKVENGKRCNYSIDYVPQINFDNVDLKLHPYVLGVIIGNGNTTQNNLRVSLSDDEVISKLNELLPNGYRLQYRRKYDYDIVGYEFNNGKKVSKVRDVLKEYSLKGKKSYEKFIPKDYLVGSYEERLWLLRGLMDTDGYASLKKTSCSYATSSERLADDVKELVHSLGGYAKVTRTKAGYKKDGEYIQCKDCFTVTICFSSSQPNPFYLKRKADRYSPKRKVLKRFITDIKYVDDEECQCIYIDDPSHLYITDDYIITHNTTLEKFFTSWIIGRHQEDYNLFFSHSGDITRMFYDGVLDITTSEEYNWSKIFPTVKLESTDAKRECINFGKYKPFANLQCTSVGSKNAGKVRCNRYLLCDDLIGGIEEALNKNMLDKLWRIYGTDARQRKLNEKVKEIHIATRWSVHDVIGHLQRAYVGNDRTRFIAIPDIDPITGESNFDYEFNGMSVEFFHDQELLMDDISYKCLYKNEPIEREGMLYHDDELRRYLTLPIEKPDAIIGICDTKNEGTDFMFLPVMYNYGDDYYMVDCVCDDNADFGVQHERLASLIVEHRMQKVEFESNNGGSRVAFNVGQLVKQKGGECNITTNITSSNKETKIIVNAPWVKKHVIFKDKSLYSQKSDYGKAMEWLLKYSTVGKNTHDDVPDGLAQFAIYVANGLGVKVKYGKRPF